MVGNDLCVGENLVDVNLMAHIPDKFVLWVLKTAWRAMVSSTTPRFGPRWPPALARPVINSCRISPASVSNCGASFFHVRRSVHHVEVSAHIILPTNPPATASI